MCLLLTTLRVRSLQTSILYWRICILDVSVPLTDITPRYIIDYNSVTDDGIQVVVLLVHNLEYTFHSAIDLKLVSIEVPEWAFFMPTRHHQSLLNESVHLRT